MSNIDKVTDQIIKELEDSNWAKVDRLQLTLAELVKIEVANIEASVLHKER